MRVTRVHTVLLLGLFVVTSFFFLHSRPSSNTPRSTSLPKSAIISLVRPHHLDDVLEMIRNVEDRWNHRFNHDWVFISEQDFKEEFTSVVSAFVSGEAHFRTVNRKEHWILPGSVDRSRLIRDMKDLERDGVSYAGSSSYRMMCRFQAGFFQYYLPDYKYFARIDPDVRFLCDITDDLFAQMHENQYKLGFSIALRESPHSIHNLSSETNQFMKKNPDLIAKTQWLDSFVQPWETGCHFWSNFEVGDLDFFRSDQYRAYFDWIDASGGIFYHRWGDAPIHSIAASLFLDIAEVHWFSEIGTTHGPNTHCPTDQSVRLEHRCTCGMSKHADIFTYKEQSCTPLFLHLQNTPFESDWEKYSDVNIRKAFLSVTS